MGWISSRDSVDVEPPSVAAVPQPTTNTIAASPGDSNSVVALGDAKTPSYEDAPASHSADANYPRTPYPDFPTGTASVANSTYHTGPYGQPSAGRVPPQGTVAKPDNSLSAASGPAAQFASTRNTAVRQPARGTSGDQLARPWESPAHKPTGFPVNSTKSIGQNDLEFDRNSSWRGTTNTAAEPDTSTAATARISFTSALPKQPPTSAFFPERVDNPLPNNHALPKNDMNSYYGGHKPAAQAVESVPPSSLPPRVQSTMEPSLDERDEIPWRPGSTRDFPSTETSRTGSSSLGSVSGPLGEPVVARKQVDRPALQNVSYSRLPVWR